MHSHTAWCFGEFTDELHYDLLRGRIVTGLYCHRKSKMSIEENELLTGFELALVHDTFVLPCRFLFQKIKYTHANRNILLQSPWHLCTISELPLSVQVFGWQWNFFKGSLSMQIWWETLHCTAQVLNTKIMWEAGNSVFQHIPLSFQGPAREHSGAVSPWGCSGMLLSSESKESCNLGLWPRNTCRREGNPPKPCLWAPWSL